MSPRQPGRLMALDVGGKRIGVAVADETRTIASPVGVVARGPEDWVEIARLIEQWNVSGLVLGLPTGLSGREGPQAADVRYFAKGLAAVLGPEPPIAFWDERLTTTIAERALIANGTRRARRKEQIDAVAAAVILQDYLDAARHRHARNTMPSRPPREGSDN